MANNLFGYLVGVAHEQCAEYSALRLKVPARHLPPSAFHRHAAESARKARKEIIVGFSCRGSHVARRMHTHLELRRGMPGATSRLPIQVHHWTKASRFPTDDRDHQGEPQLAGANE